MFNTHLHTSKQLIDHAHTSLQAEMGVACGAHRQGMALEGGGGPGDCWVGRKEKSHTDDCDGSRLAGYAKMCPLVNVRTWYGSNPGGRHFALLLHCTDPRQRYAVRMDMYFKVLGIVSSAHEVISSPLIACCLYT